MIKQFTRTFHPIGQGAFYTEKIVTEAKPEGYNIVYDCGSTTLRPPISKGDQLRKYINNTFLQTDEIDLLFISHFHADHINGLEFLKKRCNIKKVVMPLLDDTAKILARISLALDGEDTTIIDNPNSYFGSDTAIIEVNPVPEVIPAGEEILESLISGKINSGSRIRIDTDWYYIPYNYEFKSRSLKFIKELKSLGLDLKDVETIDQIKNNEAEIIKAYKKVDRKLNSLSLILYSGDYNTKMKTYYSKYHFRYFKTNNSGCLYLGDIDLNQVDVRGISSNMGRLWSTISTIQIPHHGSIGNFKDSILSSSMKLAVLSYGTTNGYGHPSSYILSRLLLHNIYPFHITEIQNSIVIQFKR